MATEIPSLTITDPMEVPAYDNGWFSRLCRLALYEARDEVFVRLTLRMIALMSTMMVALYTVLHFNVVPAWVAAAVYLAVWGWFVPPVILMLHCTMHRPFLRSPKILDKAHPFVMTFFFGMPAGYREHHMGMHHVEDNMQDDLSSTMRYQRDSFLNFLMYFFRFFLLSIIELPLYLVRHRRTAMAQRAVLGEFAHMGAIAAAFALDWRFGAIAFLFPYVTCRFMMMTGNWGQHAFVNTERKNNGIANSVTCINSDYNRRCFNDGYHIGHHLKANRHWSELPGDFQTNQAQYAREGAIVFEGIDFFMVSVLLWTGRYDILAKKFVRLDGVERSDDEVIAMLKARVKPVRSWPLENIGEASTA